MLKNDFTKGNSNDDALRCVGHEWMQQIVAAMAVSNTFVPAKRSKNQRGGNEGASDYRTMSVEYRQLAEVVRKEVSKKSYVCKILDGKHQRKMDWNGLDWTEMRSKEETRVDQEKDKSPGRAWQEMVLHF